MAAGSLGPNLIMRPVAMQAAPGRAKVKGAIDLRRNESLG